MENKTNKQVAVIGAGSWATAIAKILCETQDQIHWWVRNQSIKEHIEQHQHNPNYLSSVEFDLQKIKLSFDINHVVNNADIIIFVVPSIYLEDCLKNLNTSLEDKIIISAIKGIVPSTLQVVGDYLETKYQVKPNNFAVISGPCHAEEVALERLSYLTIASANQSVARDVANLLQCDYIKTKISKDYLGTEYASVLKNIYAIAAGIAHGLGYGDNFQSVLMSNSLREMNRFVKKLSPEKRNISNSAYLGDLLVTGYSYFSRNRMLGNMIGKGYTVKSAILEMSMVAEGYYASKAIYDMKAQLEVKTPIISAVYKILYKNKNPKKVFKTLCDKLD